MATGPCVSCPRQTLLRRRLQVGGNTHESDIAPPVARTALWGVVLIGVAADAPTIGVVSAPAKCGWRVRRYRATVAARWRARRSLAAAGGTLSVRPRISMQRMASLRKGARGRNL